MYYSLIEIAISIIVIGLFPYLFYALLKPEIF
ncbi:K(+)-transporting ATPase subunit F [Escherichia coli]|nr:K(+)-transporting ATPase subunit F [Salmonella enterica]EBY8737980.1 K(+)-transporting ATPase subunit F [Salmonella enterica subsp. enterica serovar Grumpensis]ECS2971934.1 K(+)-transporting ATPase subunit F [Salmonella enterica subsp. enterica serovar Bredeney]EFB2764563.1 K(+)-transporting ATPase subunit F [Escherichia coli]MLA27527.1 K(+)-transporting ATPase subunit F [Salmonella enterica subsp. enterica serovar Worthington]HBQ8810016.1 K(+)-transporting ATPase subunit F [Klebsiella pneu